MFCLAFASSLLIGYLAFAYLMGLIIFPIGIILGIIAAIGIVIGCTVLNMLFYRMDHPGAFDQIFSRATQKGEYVPYAT